MSVFMIVAMLLLSATTYILLKKSTEERYDSQVAQSTETIITNLDIWAKGKKDLQLTASQLSIMKELDIEKILEYSSRLEGAMPDAETSYALIDADGFVHLPGDIKVDLDGYEHYQSGIAGNNELIGPVASAVDGRPIALSVAPIKNDRTYKKGI